ncbi:MAG: hypothetical protein ACOX6J_02155 [Oscillospiraceae bacterium]|jgi:DNA-binding beta-propeller fold protein YncE
MEIRHLNEDRSREQKLIVGTEDGTFRYEVLMDYPKGLPDDLALVPYSGNISGGTVDSEGNLLCGLRGGSMMNGEPVTQILKFDSDGNYIESLGKGAISGTIHFIAEAPDGRIYITISSGNYCIILSKDGSTERICGPENEEGESSIDSIYLDLLLHKGIIPTEPFHGRKMDMYAWSRYIETGKMRGPFHNPTDVSFDSKGNCYFSDGYSNFAVHKYDSRGNYIKSFGGKGVIDPTKDTPGKFLVPHSICVDANDNIWVCDREKDAVHVFDNEGNVIGYARGNMGQPSGVDTDGKYVYVAGRGGYLTIFDLEMNIVGELGFFNGNLRAHDIAADKNGNLYLFPTKANYEHQIIALKRV